jgi:hypothetical protein
MYDLAKKGRDALKKKARRLAGEKDQKVDSSDWSPPEKLNANVKTGMRPISRRAYKSGGKVEGECPPMNAGKKPRKSGGSVKAEASEWMKSKINRDVKKANEEREGEKHVGGLKTGGRAKKANGGGNGAANANKMTTPEYRKELESRQNPQSTKPHTAPPMAAPTNKPADMSTMTADEAAEFMKSRKNGGRAKKMGGGYIPHHTKAGKPEIPGMKKGGRTERKSGGRVGKGKTNINIVIATKPMDGQSDAVGPGVMRAPAGMRPPGGVPVPMPMPSAGMPMPMPPGGGLPMPPGGSPMGGPPMPLARKRGGRTYKTYKDMDAGAGSGVGRLEKTEIASRK